MAIGSSRGSIDPSAQASDPARSIPSPWASAGEVDLPGAFDELASVEVTYLARLAASAGVIPPSLRSFLR